MRLKNLSVALVALSIIHAAGALGPLIAQQATGPTGDTAQSAGRADLTGKLHVIELPVHITLTAGLIFAAGVDGAAVASLFRAVTDAAVVVWMASRVLGRDIRLGRRYVLLVCVGIVTMLGAAAPIPLAGRLLWVLAALVIAAYSTWRFLVDDEDRAALSSEATAAWARLRRAVS